MMPTAAFRHHDGSWLIFDSPVRTLCAVTHAEVLPCLQEVERYVHEGRYAAGFISYEAAPAFDRAFAAFPPDGFPLVWFVVCDRPSIVTQPLPESNQGMGLEWDPSVSEIEYHQALNAIHEFIARGDTYQVNFTFRLKSAFTLDPWEYFRAVHCGHPVPFASFITTGRYAICSFSPELFFRLEGTGITAQPMKGTARRGRNNKEDTAVRLHLRNSTKELAENIMIVDMIRNDIGKITPFGSVTVPELCVVQKYSTVFQMISTVKGETSASLVEIINALFPCASITGAPKIRTSEIIASLETTPRHVYCGTTGWYAPGRHACFNVAIRTVLIDTLRGEAEYGTGGGIVWESSSDREFEECRLKAHIVTHPTMTFSLVETLLWDEHGGYFLLDLHLARLADTARYFDFTLDIIKVKNGLMEHVASEVGRRKVRLLLGRNGITSIESVPFDDILHRGVYPVTVCFADAPINTSDRFLYHKTTCREQYEQRRSRVPDGDDLVFFNEKGEVTEMLIGNIVVEIDNHFYTPPVECGLLGGVFRQWLIGRTVIREKIITRQDLYHARSIYRINSVRKWQQCRLVETAGKNISSDCSSLPRALSNCRNR